MSITLRIVPIIFFSAAVSLVYSQQSAKDCEQTLNQATAEFNAGRFYEVFQLIQPCLESGFTREQRQRANLLMTQIYLIQGDPVGAENSYLNVLRANPEFLADTARDPIDVVYLSKKFIADPILSVFGRIGGNTSPVRVIHTVNPSGEIPVDKRYLLLPGWHVGGGIDVNMMPELAITAEFNYALTAYRKKNTKFNQDELVLTDRQHWLMLPVSVKYARTKGDIRPYGYAGIAFQWLFIDRGQIDWTKNDPNPEGGPNISNSIPSPTIDFMPYRNRINRSFFIGGGVRYKIGFDFLFADLRYAFGMTNLVVPTSTFASTGPMPEFAHADDYFRLDNLAFSVGYVKPFYKPRKLKVARTKSILRGLGKGKK